MLIAHTNTKLGYGIDSICLSVAFEVQRVKNGRPDEKGLNIKMSSV